MALDPECLVEALLFVADGPVAIIDLARAIESDVPALETILQRLGASLAQRGLRIARAGAQAQLVTAPEASGTIERFLGISGTSKLSPAALETLAVVAYRQPITRAQIDSIRGVNSDAVLRTLLAKALVAPVGRLEQVGRPILFGTTFEFLQYLGIQSLADLPILTEPENQAAAPVEQPE